MAKSITHGERRRNPTDWLLVIALLLLPCLVLLSCSQNNPPPQVYPAADAPVTAAIDGNSFIITNRMDQSIYHLVFPTDILEVIEWAPCLAPETCPEEQLIEPGQEKRIAVRAIVRDDTESITVFWWRYLERAPGASIPPMAMNEFVLPIP